MMGLTGEGFEVTAGLAKTPPIGVKFGKTGAIMVDRPGALGLVGVCTTTMPVELTDAVLAIIAPRGKDDKSGTFVENPEFEQF